MSKEIKFRGKRVDNGEWVYGNHAEFVNHLDGDAKPGIQITRQVPSSIDRNIPAFETELIEVIPETVGQFTGLHGKNGKEIYEGDIVVADGYIWFDKGIPNYRGTVEWIYSQWQVVAHCVNPNKRGIYNGINEGLNDDGLEDGAISNWEVMGNIYENPELLEVLAPCQSDT